MNLLICDGPAYPGGNPRYRGTYRAVPSYCDNLPPDHEINRMFMWYLEEGGESGVVRDLSKACRFADSWNTHLGQRAFEVIEVTEGEAPAETTGEFLGFDLSAGYGFSLLGAGGLMERGRQALQEPVGSIDELMTKHFGPLVNHNGLFAVYESAAFCLRVMAALQRIHPGLFESGDLSDFEVVGIHIAWPRTPGTV
ncbi:MAG: hypothetical protein NTV86_08875 [Planctomycetota bacterium]|nr:hypothetical protein [Planctomycetota bacterium]